jgi:hypothetical protein
VLSDAFQAPLVTACLGGATYYSYRFYFPSGTITGRDLPQTLGRTLPGARRALERPASGWAGSIGR